MRFFSIFKPEIGSGGLLLHPCDKVIYFEVKNKYIQTRTIISKN